jgi:hypothetical protein
LVGGSVRKVANGSLLKMSRVMKNTCTTMIVPTTKPIMSRWRRALTATAIVENAPSTNTQNRSEPSSAPQNAVILYDVVIDVSLVAATYLSVKSWVKNA